MIVPMQHDIGSFLDIAFILPLGCKESDLVRTIVFCDDLDRLTEMFWWAFARAAHMQLPTHVVDIIHSGLSSRHQEMALKDFREGKTHILLGSSKISAGMNFPGVQRVIQYGCDGLTVPDADQRRGRGARQEDERSVGIFFVEPKLLAGDITVEHPGDQDPGMIELIQSEECAEKIIQKLLGNAKAWTRHESFDCCNRCDPTYRPPREYKWVDVNPTPGPVIVSGKTTDLQKTTIYNKLIDWRLEHWKNHWREDWPNYGPKSLISDSDLEEIAKRTSKIFSVEDLKHYTHIVHWAALSPHLFDAVQDICEELNVLPVIAPEEVTPSASKAQKSATRKRKRAETHEEVLQAGEIIAMDLSKTPNYQGT
jgi:hypothetical protein